MWREEGTARSLGGMAQGPTTTTGLGATQAPLWLHHRPALAVVGWEGFCPAYQPQGCEARPPPRHQPLRVTFSMQLARLFLPLPLGHGLRTGSGQAGAPPGGRRPLSRCCECSSIPGAPPPITDQPISPRDRHSKAPGLLGVGCGPGQGGPGTAPGDLPLLPAALSNLLPKAKPAATQDTLG